MFCTRPFGYVHEAFCFETPAPQSQLAMCAARAREIYEKQAKERQLRKPSDSVPANFPEQTKGDASDKVGEAFGVSGTSVDYATKVIEKLFRNSSRLLVA